MTVRDVQKKLEEIQDMPAPETLGDMWKQFVEFARGVAVALEDVDSALEEVNDGLDPDKLLEEIRRAEQGEMRRRVYSERRGVQRLF